MTPTLTDTIADRVIYRAWNQGDLDAMDEVVAPGYIRHLSDGRTLHSRDEFKRHIATIRTAMPDLRTRIQHSFSNGAHSAARFTTTATLANGTALRFDGAVIIRIEDGVLAEEWEFFDTAAIEAALAPTH